MRELSTIQKREKLNIVYAIDEPDVNAGNACHRYLIKSKDCDEQGNYSVYETIQMQHGARKLDNSTHGIIDTDLLEIVRDRLKGFQSGEFATRENACALTHIEEALMWLNKRVENRIERNVLGKNEK